MSNTPGRTDFSRLYRIILEELGAGHYHAGRRLSVKELADRLRVSPTPIREILSRLVGRGVIEERRSEGYYVTRLEVRDIADLYRLHGHCTDLALRELAWPPALPPSPVTDGMWLLSRLVEATGNLVLRETLSYLDDRLLLVRHYERLTIEGLDAEADDLVSLCARPDRGMLRQATARFYRRRIAAAPALALLLGRS